MLFLLALLVLPSGSARAEDPWGSCSRAIDHLRSELVRVVQPMESARTAEEMQGLDYTVRGSAEDSCPPEASYEDLPAELQRRLSDSMEGPSSGVPSLTGKSAAEALRILHDHVQRMARAKWIATLRGKVRPELDRLRAQKSRRQGRGLSTVSVSDRNGSRSSK